MKKKTLFLSIALLIVLVAQNIVAEIKPVSYPKFIKLQIPLKKLEEECTH